MMDDGAMVFAACVVCTLFWANTPKTGSQAIMTNDSLKETGGTGKGISCHNGNDGLSKES